MAMLQAVVVLPSSGCELVTSTTLPPPLLLLKASAVRSERKASPNSCGDFGRQQRRFARRGTFGIMPRNGAFSFAVMSSGVFTVSSR